MGFMDKLRRKTGTTPKGSATDPVCHMTVVEAEAAGTARHGATTYYFCSSACQSRFESDPHAYLGAHTH